MGVPADRNWICIKCGNATPIGPCRNCAYEGFVQGYGRLECGRCGEELRIPRCAQCGTLTPIERARIERPGDHHAWALYLMAIVIALLFGCPIILKLGELWEQLVK